MPTAAGPGVGRGTQVNPSQPPRSRRPAPIPPAYTPAPPAPDPARSAGYIPWWLLGIVAVAFLVFAIGLLAFVLLTRPAELPRATATAVVITAVPATPAAPLPTGGATAAATVPPTEPTGTPPPPPPGEVAVGAYVQVVGTGDAGFLNLRAEPSLAGSVNYLALENEVFQVQAGPTNADGFVWWYLVDPATNTRYGWAVQNYLQVVQGP
jgi:hypothetical protein